MCNFEIHWCSEAPLFGKRERVISAGELPSSMSGVGATLASQNTSWATLLHMMLVACAVAAMSAVSALVV